MYCILHCLKYISFNYFKKPVLSSSIFVATLSNSWYMQMDKHNMKINLSREICKDQTKKYIEMFLKLKKFN